MANRLNCPTCSKPFAVTTSRASDGVLVQYFGCRKCGIYKGQKPNVVTLSDASSTNRVKLS